MIVLLAPVSACAGDITLSMVDAPTTQALSNAAATSIWRHDLSVYAGAGVTNIRVTTGWSDQQFPNGTWRNPTTLPYMQAALDSGMRLTIDLETIAAPPSWFINAHPDARLVDQNGLTTQYQTISYWYPGLQALIHASTDTMLSTLAASGVLSGADAVIVSLGAADEPIYPPQWVIGGSAVPGFWCYDLHAQADFAAKMQAKYGTIAAANAAWGTSYASYAALRVPKPGSVPVAEWADVISWYRNAKRIFVAWQIADTRAELLKWAPTHTPVLEIPVPGEHISGDELNAALTSESSSDPNIVQMHDTDFLLDHGAIAKAAAHFTGMPDMTELEYIRGYIHGRGYDGQGMRLTAENTGGASMASDGAEDLRETLAADLDGFDYLYGSTLFASDGITATPSLAPALGVMTAMATGRDEPRTTLSLVANFALVQKGCVDIAQAAASSAATQLCLSSVGQLSVVRGTTVLWQAASSAQTCASDVLWSKSCFALFQADGNLVLYNGQTGYWATGTSANGANMATTLRLSSSAPYLTLVNAAGATVWNSGVR